MSVGIAEAIAEDLADRHNAVTIAHQIRHLALARKYGKKPIDYPARWLRTALEGSWQIPAEYERREAVAEQEARRQAIQGDTLARCRALSDRQEPLWRFREANPELVARWKAEAIAQGVDKWVAVGVVNARIAAHLGMEAPAPKQDCRTSGSRVGEDWRC